MMRKALVVVLLLAAQAASADVATFSKITGTTSGLKQIITDYKATETTLQGGTLSTWWLWGLSSFDYNKDGKQDIIFSIHTVGAAGTVPGPQIIRNNGGSWTNVTAALVGSARGMPGIDGKAISWDFNNDTWPDIGLFSEAGSPNQYLSSGGTSFSALSASTMSPLYRIDFPYGRLTDLNADGYLDADQDYENPTTSGQVLTWSRTYNIGTGKWDLATTYSSRPAGLPAAIGLQITSYMADTVTNRFLKVRYFTGYDLDGDGDNDMIVCGYGSYGAVDFTYVLENTGGGTFVDRTAAWGLSTTGHITAIADLDGDGKLDLVVSRGATGAAGVWFWNGAGYTQAADASMQAFLKIVDPYVDRVYVQDFNNDGLKDLVISKRRNGKFGIYGQGSARSFTSIYASGYGETWDSDGIWIADIDGDGDLDVVAGGPGDDITIFDNTSVGGTPPSPSVVIDSPGGLPAGTENVAYSSTLAATGSYGAGPPFTWTKTAGSLPTGLSLSSAGVISGTPTVAGTYVATIKACDGTPTCSATKDFSITISAQVSLTHPRAILTSAITTRLATKRAGADADWLTMKGFCDFLITDTGSTTDHLPPVYAPNEPESNTPTGTIDQEYQGGGYERTLMSLGPCYYGLVGSDPTTANKYKAQAKKVVLAASSPFVSVTPAISPANWDGLTTRGAYSVTNEGPGGQARVYLSYHGFSAGDTVTIAGVLGCTSANLSGKVGTVAEDFYFDLLSSDGAPVICNGPGTNYAFNPHTDDLYGSRNYLKGLALGYDWFQSEWTSGEKAQIFAAGNMWSDEIKHSWKMSGFGNASLQDVQTNYYGGHFAGIGLWGICTRGTNENSRGQEWYDYWTNALVPQTSNFFTRWLGNHAGFPDTIHYQRGWVENMMLPVLSDYVSNAVDRWAVFTWITDYMKYLVHNTMPPRTYQLERGYVSAPGDTLNGNVPARTYADQWWMTHHIGALTSNSFRPYFKSWIADIESYANPTKSYFSDRYDQKALWWDSSLSSTTWTSETLSDAEMSNPAGGYGHVLMRSDWTTAAVFGDLAGYPYTASVWNGKQMWDSGSLLVQRGDTHLLVHGDAEATRAGNFNTWLDLICCADGSHEVQGIFYATNPTSGFVIPELVDYGSPFQQPGLDRPFSIPPQVATTFPTRVDKYEDQTTYVYSRAVNLQEDYIYDYTLGAYFKPLQDWSREVTYIRPGLFVVYDRTNKLNYQATTYTQKIRWVTGKVPTTAAYGSGMYRTSVADGATFKGALTHVLPAIASPTLTNYLNESAVYTIDAVPSVNNQYVNWLTVVDPASASGSLKDVVKFTSSNADVIRLGTDTVVGFANYQSGSAAAFPITYTMSGMTGIPIHRIAGLAASTNYKVTVAGNDVTINTSGGGTTVASTAAGVLQFNSALSSTPVTISTTSPLPSGTVGTAYSVNLGAVGGIGAPYDWTVVSGAFPDGLSLAGNGTLSGTPTIAGTQGVTVQACDEDGVPTCATKLFSIAIANVALSITTSGLPAASKDQAYSTTVVAFGGAIPYTYTVQAGALCTGLSLASSTGIISGTPTVVQTCSFTIRATDNVSQTADKALSIQVVPANVGLSIYVSAGSDSAVVQIGATGLPKGTSCTVAIYDQAPLLIQQVVVAVTASRQQVGFAGLLPGTTYTATANCLTIGGPISVSFRTYNATTGNRTIPIAIGTPPSILVAPARVTVDYGPTTAVDGGFVQNTSCGSGCTVNLSLPKGLYYYRWRWQNAANVVLATSAIQPMSVP